MRLNWLQCVMPASQNLNDSIEGDKTTSAGRLLHNWIFAGKKLVECFNAPRWNTELEAMLQVFGIRYNDARITINPCTIRYIMMALE